LAFKLERLEEETKIHEERQKERKKDRKKERKKESPGHWKPLVCLIPVPELAISILPR